MKHSTILALAPNGAYKRKSDHPAIPINTVEIVETTEQAVRTGATLLHLHVRDPNGRHSLDPDTYGRTIDAIRERLGDQVIIQITSEAAGLYTPQQQIASIKAVRPQSVSIALRELVPDQTALPAAQKLFHWCAEQECRAQFILYSESDLQAYIHYRQQDIIPSAPHFLLFVLGHYRTNQISSQDELIPFLKYHNEIDVPWMVCAFGAIEHSNLIDAARLGGHMRTGFENNLLDGQGHIAENNAQQLQTLEDKAKRNGIQVADISQTRKILNITR